MKPIRLSFPLILFIILGAANIFFFLQRNRMGNYVKKVSYEQLYASSNNKPGDLIKWNKSLAFYPADEIQKSQQLSSIQAGIEDGDITLVKMVKIGSWLSALLNKCPRGEPESYLAAVAPSEQLKIYAKANTRVWCGSYAGLFSFFCATNNITTRNVELVIKGNHHVVNECFVPEIGKWVMTDLTYNVLYVKDLDGNFLNLLDVIDYQTNKYLNVPKLTFAPDNDSSIQHAQTPTEWDVYMSDKANLYYYYSINVTTVYSSKEKIKRYLLPVSWYELYTKDRINNSWFYLRQFLLVFWTIVLIFIVINFLRKKRL